MTEPCRGDKHFSFPRRVPPRLFVFTQVYQTHWLLRLLAGSGSLTIAGVGTATTSVTSDDDTRRIKLASRRPLSLTALAFATCDVVMVVVVVLTVVPVELLLLASRWKWPRNWFCVIWRLWWLLRWLVRVWAVPPRDVVRFCNDGWSTEPSAAQQFQSGHRPIEWTAFSSLTAIHSNAGIWDCGRGE